MPAASGFRNFRLTGTDRKIDHRPIVATSLAFGVGLALLLVLIPFGGAPENSITGAALLGFGAGWGLLAFRAARYGQPQRWAAVAAIAVLFFAGCLFLWPRFVASVWFWPAWLFFLVVLAVWIALGARRRLNDWSRQWLIYPSAGVMLAGAIGGLYEAARESSDQTLMRGQLVDIAGRRLHLRCSGSGDPVVVLVPGAGEFSAVWGLDRARGGENHASLCV